MSVEHKLTCGIYNDRYFCDCGAESPKAFPKDAATPKAAPLGETVADVLDSSPCFGQYGGPGEARSCSLCPLNHPCGKARMMAQPAPLPGAVEETVKLLRAYADESGPCDHDANVCVCGILRTASELEAWSTALADLREQLAAKERECEELGRLRGIANHNLAAQREACSQGDRVIQEEQENARGWQARAEEREKRKAAEKEKDDAWYRGFAIAAALVCDLRGSLNSYEVFTENGVTWEQLKAHNVDIYDLKRIGRDLKRHGLLLIGRIPLATRCKAALAATEGK